MLSDVEAKLSRYNNSFMLRLFLFNIYYSAEKELNEGIDFLIKTIEQCRESAQQILQTQRGKY